MYGESNSIETIEISVSEEQSLINTLTLWDPDPDLEDYSEDDNSTWPIINIKLRQTMMTDSSWFLLHLFQLE